MMILSTQLYSHMMSVDAILPNLMVPDRTMELLHTSRDITGEGGPSVVSVNDVKVPLSCLLGSGDGGRR